MLTLIMMMIIMGNANLLVVRSIDVVEGRRAGNVEMESSKDHFKFPLILIDVNQKFWILKR